MVVSETRTPTLQTCVDDHEKSRLSFEQRLRFPAGDEINLETIADGKLRTEPADQSKVTREIKSAWALSKGKPVDIPGLNTRRLSVAKPSFTGVIQEKDIWANKLNLLCDLESTHDPSPSKKALLLELKRQPVSNCPKVIYKCPCCPCIFTRLDKLSKHLLPYRSRRNKCSNLYAQQKYLFENCATKDAKRLETVPGEIVCRNRLEDYLKIFKKFSTEGTVLEHVLDNDSTVYKSLIKPKQTKSCKRTFKCSYCPKVFSDKATCIKHLLYH